MRFRQIFLPLVGLAAGVVVSYTPASPVDVASAWTPGPRVDLSPWLSPGADLSTAGDFATDTFSDPWDFNNAEDVDVHNGVGVVAAGDASVSNGILTTPTINTGEVRLLMTWPEITPQGWPGVLTWGRDGWTNPIDAAKYTQVTMRIRADADLPLAIRWWNAFGQSATIPFNFAGGGWQTLHFDLNDRSIYKLGGDAWGGPVVRFELFRGLVANNPAVNLQLDWVRLHRADASQSPPAGLPIAQVYTPNEQGGADFATVERGDPWDFAQMSDVADSHDVTRLDTSTGDLTGTTVANDPFIALPLGTKLNGDRYHRLTVDVCYAGGFALTDTAGGGMVGRVAWYLSDAQRWTETQDIVIYPGCNKMTIDMVTQRPESINDEHTQNPTGWRGLDVSFLRFDLNEDRGARAFTLRNVTLADDAAFSTTYPITFGDAAATPNTTADIYVTTERASYAGTRVARGLRVSGGTNTFTWNGTDDTGRVMPNGTYWVYVVMRNTAGNGVGYSSGPVRIEKAVPATPSFFVPLNPSRILDTRNGIGGNLHPLETGVFTELDVTGVGGVPETGVTAVVMNVTATNTTSGGFVTAWPSGEARPLVSNLNFVPGQTVPNLVTVKIGANGRVNLFNSHGSTDLLADVVGYYTPTQPAGGGLFTAVTPARLLDTRAGTGGTTGAIAQGQSINLGVTGVGGVPASGVSAVALNVTVAEPTGAGFLTVWPTGETRPTASTHNFVPGITIANLVLAKVGANGQVSFYNSAGATHVVADVVGYFSGSGGKFVPVAPQRLVDSRDGTGGMSAAMGTSGSHSMPIATANPVPAGAKAVIVNVTSVNSSAPSYITVWPTNAARPLASTLNPRPGEAVPNQAYLRVGANGALDAFNAYGTTDLIVDVFGYVM